jgi:hypothetical protein
MQIRDAAIIAQIEQLNDHYHANIANRYMRPLLLQLPIDKWIWDSIDSFSQIVEHLQYQGFAVDDLYRHILAIAHFVDITRRQLLPVLRGRATGLSGPDKILMNMAINTFPSNVAILADSAKNLYYKLMEFDKSNAKNGPPIYLQYPELESVGVLLQTK